MPIYSMDPASGIMEARTILVMMFALMLGGLGLSLLVHFLLSVWEGARKEANKNKKGNHPSETRCEKHTPRIILH